MSRYVSTVLELSAAFEQETNSEKCVRKNSSVLKNLAEISVAIRVLMRALAEQLISSLSAPELTGEFRGTPNIFVNIYPSPKRAVPFGFGGYSVAGSSPSSAHSGCGRVSAPFINGAIEQLFHWLSSVPPSSPPN